MYTVEKAKYTYLLVNKKLDFAQIYTVKKDSLSTLFQIIEKLASQNLTIELFPNFAAAVKFSFKNSNLMNIC